MNGYEEKRKEAAKSDRNKDRNEGIKEGRKRDEEDRKRGEKEDELKPQDIKGRVPVMKDGKKNDTRPDMEQDAVQTQEYAMRILEALSGVDEELLEKSSRSGAANRSRRPRSVWRAAGAWAAVFCLMAAGIAGWRGYQMMRRAESEGTGCGAAIPNGGESMEQIQNEEKEAPETAPGDRAAEGNPDAGAAGGRNGTEDTAGENGNSAPAPTGIPETEDLQGKVPVEEGMEEAQKEGCTDTAQPEQNLILGDMKRYSVSFTEEEARKEELGEYIPVMLPEGYVFSDAGRDPDSERQNLTVYWTRGTDYICLYLEKAEEDVSVVEAEKPESYDVRLYEIPFGETVPEEYRESFDNPVFALADFDLEIVESRMYTSEDRGDTAAPGGEFRVLYPGNVVISFSGQGTAEEIWEMFCSIEFVP